MVRLFFRVRQDGHIYIFKSRHQNYIHVCGRRSSKGSLEESTLSSYHIQKRTNGTSNGMRRLLGRVSEIVYKMQMLLLR